ncbi:TPA: hypothetical protein ACG3DQ_000740 [Pseudomonas putida]
MSLYLYLNEAWHAETWVNGGKVPINPASFYRSVEREGIYTPDENLIHKSEYDLTKLQQMAGIVLSNVKDFNMTGCTGYEPLPDICNADYYEEDGLILSFSSRLSDEIAFKMKKKTCVRIISINSLKNCIDAQLGVVGQAKYCSYTSDHQRNHFLKSELDSWQAEYRLFWPLANKVEVDIPKGTAVLERSW